MLTWLADCFKNLFSWLGDLLVSLFGWLVDALSGVLNYCVNQIQFVSVALLAGFSGFAPTVSLSSLWARILSNLSWLNGPVGWIAVNWIDLPELLARMTYFGEALVAAYVVRVGFSVVRAVFDLI